MSPEEIIEKFLPPRYFQGPVYNDLRATTLAAIRSYGEQVAAAERERTVGQVIQLLVEFADRWERAANENPTDLTAALYRYVASECHTLAMLIRNQG